jgi:hypothetical protein
MVVKITNPIPHHDNHPERTQFAVTHPGKQSMILVYNWLCNHNPEVDWQTTKYLIALCSAIPAAPKTNIMQLPTRQRHHRSMHADLEHSLPRLKNWMIRMNPLM